MTFSLVAHCAETGMFGIVISSSSPAVAARCSYARAGVGAVASQNVTDPTLGPLALDLMASGSSAAEAVQTIRRDGSFRDCRQVLAVDAKGGTAIHSGTRALGDLDGGLGAGRGGRGQPSGERRHTAHDCRSLRHCDWRHRRQADHRAARRTGRGRRSKPSAFRRAEDRRKGVLACSRFALRLDGRLPDRSRRCRVGRLQTAARRLRAKSARPARSAIVWSARRSVTFAVATGGARCGRAIDQGNFWVGPVSRFDRLAWRSEGRGGTLRRPTFMPTGARRLLALRVSHAAERRLS